MAHKPGKSDAIKARIGFIIFLIVNFIFSVRCLAKATRFYLPIAIIIALICILIWRLRNEYTFSKKTYKVVSPAILVLFVLGSVIAFAKLPAASLKIDGWSTITSFWESFFSGKYVYYAKTPMGNLPGEMPFYFLLAFPFYIMGELGYFSLLGIVVFYVILKKHHISSAQQFVTLLLIAVSTFYVWEIIVRGNLFLNGALVLGSILFLLKIPPKKKELHLLISGIIIGLLLSIRGVYMIPYIIAFLYLIRMRKLSNTDMLLVGVVALICFVITFIPFVYNHSADFYKSNPIAIQESALPFGSVVFFVILAFIAGLIVQNKYDIYFYSGLILFFIALVYLVSCIYRNGFFETFVQRKADISYLILCIPFFLFYQAKIETLRNIYKLEKIR